MMSKVIGTQRNMEEMERLIEAWRKVDDKDMSLDDYIFQNAPQWFVDEMVADRKKDKELRKKGLRIG